MVGARSFAAAFGAFAMTLAFAACEGASTAPPIQTATRSSPSTPSITHTHSNRHPSPRSTTPTHTRSSTPPTVVTQPPPRSTAVAAPKGPVIVLDPGHSVPIHATDPATGLDVSDYANEPEMHDVYAVAELVRTKLLGAGYRVIMTKPTVDTPTSLLRRAQIADQAHAALALSIHDQAGSNGGLDFAQGNIVYYQSVNNYRETSSGKRITFTDSAVAALSKRYGETFQRQRAAAQGNAVTLLGNTGYNLGSRGLPPGNIWLVQLLSHVPWIYNEAGGNSSGRVGLSAADERRYAAGLVASVEACVPIKR